MNKILSILKNKRRIKVHLKSQLRRVRHRLKPGVYILNSRIVYRLGERVDTGLWSERTRQHSMVSWKYIASIFLEWCIPPAFAFHSKGTDLFAGSSGGTVLLSQGGANSPVKVLDYNSRTVWSYQGAAETERVFSNWKGLQLLYPTAQLTQISATELQETLISGRPSFLLNGAAQRRILLKLTEQAISLPRSSMKEALKYGELVQLIQSNSFCDQEPRLNRELLRYRQGILKLLEKSDHHLLHGDLTSGNIIADDGGGFKIIDFESARVLPIWFDICHLAYLDFAYNNNKRMLAAFDDAYEMLIGSLVPDVNYESLELKLVLWLSFFLVFVGNESLGNEEEADKAISGKLRTHSSLFYNTVIAKIVNEIDRSDS